MSKNTSRLRTIVIMAIKKKDRKMLDFNLSIFFCPKQIENTVPLPMERPKRMEVKKVIREYAEPTAANASAPRILPTINVSAIL